MIKYINQNIRTDICAEPTIVEANSNAIQTLPILYATGHGNIVFSESEANNLCNYVEAGGFLIFDDNYGMHNYIMREVKKLYPNSTPTELPYSHPIFSTVFPFKSGLPKVHLHDGKPPSLYGIEVNGRMAIVITHESDLGDGWEDAIVHNDPEEIRELAFQMGVNIIAYALNQINQ